MSLPSLEETLAQFEKLNRNALHTIGSEKRSIYGGLSSPDPGTHHMPRVGFHSLVILPGGKYRFDLEGGFLNSVPTRSAPEDIMFVPSGKAITCDVPEKTEITRYLNSTEQDAFYLLFPTSILHEKFEDTLRRDIDPDVSLQGLLSRPTPQFRNISRAVAHEYLEQKPGRPSMLNALTDALLIELVRIYDNAEVGFDRKDALDQQQKEAIRRLMEVAIDGEISMGDIAEELELSPASLTRRFRATFQMTPSEYLLSIRLDRARRELIETDLSIAEIAYNCGFSSQAHLTTRFSRAFGIAPAKFRMMR